MTNTTSNIDTRRYLDALEQFDEKALADIFHPDVVQRELPNKLTPGGAVRDFNALTESFRKGRQVLKSQRYDVKDELVVGERAALQVEWTGELANGNTMRASFAIFLKYRDGKIVEQLNYDCFWP